MNGYNFFSSNPFFTVSELEEDFNSSFKNIGSLYELQNEMEEGYPEFDDRTNINIIEDSNIIEENSSDEKDPNKVSSSKDLFSNYFWNERK